MMAEVFMVPGEPGRAWVPRARQAAAASNSVTHSLSESVALVPGAQSSSWDDGGSCNTGEDGAQDDGDGPAGEPCEIPGITVEGERCEEPDEWWDPFTEGCECSLLWCDDDEDDDPYDPGGYPGGGGGGGGNPDPDPDPDVCEHVDPSCPEPLTSSELASIQNSFQYSRTSFTDPAAESACSDMRNFATNEINKLLGSPPPQDTVYFAGSESSTGSYPTHAGEATIGGTVHIDPWLLGAASSGAPGAMKILLEAVLHEGAHAENQGHPTQPVIDPTGSGQTLEANYSDAPFKYLNKWIPDATSATGWALNPNSCVAW